MSRNIFLSYARADRSIAENLVRKLEDNGFRVWWDFQIPSGRSFASVIAEKLEEAPAVLVLWTRASVGSRHVFDEATFGLEHSKLLSVRYGDDFRLPIGFGGIHTDDIKGWFELGDEAIQKKLLQELAAATSALEAEPVLMSNLPSEETLTTKDIDDADTASPTEARREKNAVHDGPNLVPSIALGEFPAVAFVASGQIPASPPPPNAVGPVKWVKDNLFPGPVNSALTILSVAFVALVLYEILPWLIDSSWSPAEMSLAGCRAEASGACFAVINERFYQFFFGFYPEPLYWRPTLAFLIVIVAIYPTLFSSAPRPLLIVTALAPFAGYWLIWGGSLWGPLAVLAAPAVGWAVFRFGGGAIRAAAGEAFGPLVTLIAAVAATILCLLFAVGPVTGGLEAALPIGLEPVASNKLGGFMLSLIIGLVGIAGSLPLGIALALGRQSKLLIVKALSVGFIETMRGVPLITLLFVASTLLNYFMPPGSNFDLILRVCIMVTIFASAYMAEVIRGGIAALPKGQYEAADAMGLTYAQSMRFIILPQALKISIPNIVSNFIGLFKDTTLVIVIGLLDPLGLSSAIRANQAWNGVVWELYGFVALFFFIFCFGMSRYSQWLERRLRTDHR